MMKSRKNSVRFELQTTEVVGGALQTVWTPSRINEPNEMLSGFKQFAGRTPANFNVPASSEKQYTPKDFRKDDALFNYNYEFSFSDGAPSTPQLEGPSSAPEPRPAPKSEEVEEVEAAHALCRYLSISPDKSVDAASPSKDSLEYVAVAGSVGSGESKFPGKTSSPLAAERWNLPKKSSPFQPSDHPNEGIPSRGLVTLEAAHLYISPVAEDEPKSSFEMDSTVYSRASSFLTGASDDGSAFRLLQENKQASIDVGQRSLDKDFVEDNGSGNDDDGKCDLISTTREQEASMQDQTALITNIQKRSLRDRHKGPFVRPAGYRLPVVASVLVASTEAPSTSVQQQSIDAGSMLEDDSNKAVPVVAADFIAAANVPQQPTSSGPIVRSSTSSSTDFAVHSPVPVESVQICVMEADQTVKSSVKSEAPKQQAAVVSTISFNNSNSSSAIGGVSLTRPLPRGRRSKISYPEGSTIINSPNSRSKDSNAREQRKSVMPFRSPDLKPVESIVSSLREPSVPHANNTSLMNNATSDRVPVVKTKGVIATVKTPLELDAAQENVVKISTLDKSNRVSFPTPVKSNFGSKATSRTPLSQVDLNVRNVSVQCSPWLSLSPSNPKDYSAAPDTTLIDNAIASGVKKFDFLSTKKGASGTNHDSHSILRTSCERVPIDELNYSIESINWQTEKDAALSPPACEDWPVLHGVVGSGSENGDSDNEELGLEDLLVPWTPLGRHQSLIELADDGNDSDFQPLPLDKAIQEPVSRSFQFDIDAVSAQHSLGSPPKACAEMREVASEVCEINQDCRALETLDEESFSSTITIEPSLFSDKKGRTPKSQVQKPPRLVIAPRRRRHQETEDMKEVVLSAEPGSVTTVVLRFSNTREDVLTMKPRAIQTRFDKTVFSNNLEEDIAQRDSEVESIVSFSVAPRILEIPRGSESFLYIGFSPSKNGEGVYSGVLKIKVNKKHFVLLLRGEAYFKRSQLLLPELNPAPEANRRTYAAAQTASISKTSAPTSTPSKPAPEKLSTPTTTEPREEVNPATPAEALCDMRQKWLQQWIQRSIQKGSPSANPIQVVCSIVTVCATDRQCQKFSGSFELRNNGKTERTCQLSSTMKSAVEFSCGRNVSLEPHSTLTITLTTRLDMASAEEDHLGFLQIAYGGGEELILEVKSVASSLKSTPLATDTLALEREHSVNHSIPSPAFSSKIVDALTGELNPARCAVSSPAVSLSTSYALHQRMFGEPARRNESASSFSLQGASSNSVTSKVSKLQDHLIFSENRTENASTEKSGVFFRSKHLDFGSVPAGTLTRRKIELCNTYDRAVVVSLVDPALPFVLLHNEIHLQPRSFVQVPVRFIPVNPREQEHLAEIVAHVADADDVNLKLRVVLSGASY